MQQGGVASEHARSVANHAVGDGDQRRAARRHQVRPPVSPSAGSGSPPRVDERRRSGDGTDESGGQIQSDSGGRPGGSLAKNGGNGSATRVENCFRQQREVRRIEKRQAENREIPVQASD